MKKILALVICICLAIFTLTACQLASWPTVTFDSKGGTEIESTTANLNGKVTMPEAPTREGYKFIEWRLDGAAWSFDEKVPKEGIVLAAAWEHIDHFYSHDCDATCDATDCSYERSTESHEFDHDCDASCNVDGCDYARATEHKWSHDCDTECNTEGCGATRATEHKWSDACDTACNTEGCTFTREVPHVYDNVCDSVCGLC